MRYSLLIPLLMMFHVVNVVHAFESIPSYQESFNQFMEKAKASKSPFSEKDKAIMEKAGKSLASSLPDPGIKVGEKAPDFILKNAFGKEVNLKDELKKGPVVLVFYRGAWCPFCNIHLHVLQKTCHSLKDMALN